jgi:pimeloyl-ACP methyl ester carboxylesterase
MTFWVSRLAVLLAASVAVSPSAEPQRTAGAAATTAPQTTSIPCEDIALPSVRCSTISVPENRTTGKGRMITLRVAVLPARGASRAEDAVFFLAGGPGQAATTFLRDPGMARHSLGTRRDLVFLDQRGTGRSNPLICHFYKPEDYAQGAFADFIPVVRARECRAALEAGADLAQYTTAASVADLDDVRKALGYARINLSGGSYGTRLAMEYVRAHPHRVRAVILDGAVPASLRMPEGFGRSAQQALDGVFDECAATPACAKAFPDIRNESRAVFERLSRGPISTSVSGVERAVRMTRNNVAEAVRYLTYSSRGASRVPRLLHRAHQGDFTGLADYLRDYRNPGTFEALYLSITCAEDVPFLSKDAAAQDEDTYLGGYRVREQQAACAEWPRGAAPAWQGQPVRADVPVLITTGLLDPVTPASGGDLVAKTLPNSLHLKVPAGGHGFAGLRGLECLVEIKREFIERASVVGLNTDCLKRIARPAFEM